MTVEDLIAKIVEYHSPRDLVNRLESLPAQSRPRAYLASFIEQLPSRDADYNIGMIETAIRLLFLTMGPYRAMLRCCYLRPLIRLYQGKAGESRFDPRISRIEEVVQSTLELFEIPAPAAISFDLLSPSEAIDRIDTIERSFMRSIDVQRLDVLQLQGGTINAWALVEGVLKLSLGYFALHFVSFLPDKLLNSIRKGLRKGSAGDIVRAFREVETFFEKGELKAEAKSRHSRIGEELKRIENTEERMDRRRQLEEEDKRLQNQKMQLARQVRDGCWRDFGRVSPFCAVDTSQYQQIISLHRNKFAHKPVEQLITDPNALDPVRESLYQAKKIIQQLREARVAPRIVTIMGSGTDDYGNRIIWFAERSGEDEIEMSQEWEWMYVTSGIVFMPFQQLALLAPNVVSGQQEPLIDPVVYPVQKIQAFVDQN